MNSYIYIFIYKSTLFINKARNPTLKLLRHTVAGFGIPSPKTKTWLSFHLKSSYFYKHFNSTRYRTHTFNVTVTLYVSHSVKLPSKRPSCVLVWQFNIYSFRIEYQILDEQMHLVLLLRISYCKTMFIFFILKIYL